ncbi:MAG: phosphopantetheine adenylyltransferase [Blastopirellula sp.]|nr:MAG: phosphopantetheine adenylyltransferase [Blastopirellula sp.]
MNHLITGLLAVAGIIHLLPLTGVLGGSHLFSLYEVKIEDPNLLILMRHRAVLFALLGLLLVYAAFKPSFHVVAMVGGLVSATAFLWLAVTASGHNLSITKSVYVDVIAIVCLLIAATIKWLNQPS